MANYTFFDHAAPPSGGAFDGGNEIRTFGLVFEATSVCAVIAIWFYSAPDGETLPDWCGVYDTTTQDVVTENSSPSWSGAAGSGWVSCPAPSFSLATSRYYTASFAYAGSGTSNVWQSVNYFSTGPGANGITSGPLSAPGNTQAAAAGFEGQEIYSAYNPGYPNEYAYESSNWWVDIEVAASPSGLMMASGIL